MTKASYIWLLDEIERKEMLSLSWGYVDGSLSRAEVLRIAKEVISGRDIHEDPEDMLEGLIERCLVFEFRGERIRSRFAELVRLLSQLRQLFPNKPWYGAPKLVSDFHVDIRRRRYPRRNRSASDILSDHPEILGLTDLRKLLWTELAEFPQLLFAEFQERSVVRLLNAKPDAATIITAGTGSGKTMAFYLPALLQISEHVISDEHWVKALAIYPRIELLKDQLADAFRRTRLIDDVMLRNGQRQITLGAYFSSTPNRVSTKDIKDKWPSKGTSFVCPWFRCPVCGEELLWHNIDIEEKRERLVCSVAQCGYTINDTQLVLTREKLATTPPDILFTTTEMLNQRMSDLKMRRLFGIGLPYSHRPLLALLDEVHTYVGTSGAQAALVFRRWRHLVAAPVKWCGLSATLCEAPRFFSDLTGTALDNVVEITPTNDELIDEGAEYQVVLRGDPMLQASLLSSSIQVAMLVARMMDPGLNPLSDGNFGRRLFVFTDNLDVINRLFDNLRDAEAYTIFGRPDPLRQPLAALRGRGDDDQRRDMDGQRWSACEKIGRSLNNRLIVGRTSSQDAGVLIDADVIVATASLEVGYNDDQVGAIVQHKAPRNMASFLQRKGRAGRVRGMRPLTVTMLSDYGRDRVAFQAYEHLFDPELPPQYLPILNQYVLRMQAVFSLFDWLAQGAPKVFDYGWMWDVLSRPCVNENLVHKYVKKRLTELVRGEPVAVAALHKHLQGSLRISPEAVDSLLWEPPRSIMLEVVPTLARRLFLNWRIATRKNANKLVNKVESDFQVDYHPLPDFIPRNLFSDLSLPEVQVMLPPATVNDNPREEALPLVQALLQLVPGRVTRRYAVERGRLCHWVDINVDMEEQTMSIDNYSERNELLGIFEGQNSNGKVCVPVYRPWTISLTQTKPNVDPTSNAFPVWYSGFVPQGTPVIIGTPPRSPWFAYVTNVNFYLHHFRSSVAVRRFTPETNATIRQKNSEKLIQVKYVDSIGEPAALGFEIEVDGFHVDFIIPSGAELIALKLPKELVASSRRAYHRYLLQSDTDLPLEITPLLREWMHQILFSAAMTRAFRDNIAIGKAAELLLSENPEKAFEQVMNSLFYLQDIEAEADDVNEENDSDFEDSFGKTNRVSRLQDRLRISFGRPDVLTKLKLLAPELDNPDPDKYGSWLRYTLHETLAEALLQACINTAPKHAAIDTLVSDFEVIHDGDISRVWITESTIGGAGVIQAFAEAFAHEPRALFRALEATLAPTDLELSSNGLKRFLILACEDSVISELTAELRANSDHAIRNTLRARLYQALALRGVDVSHALSVSLNTRILRPGTGPEWDKLVHELLGVWEKLEAQFTLAIGVREFCYIVLGIPALCDQLRLLLNTVNNKVLIDIDLIQVLSGLLWPRGIEIRQRTLQSYNPFRTHRVTDPALIRFLMLAPNVSVVSISSTDWHAECSSLLAEFGIVHLVAERSVETNMKAAIVKLVCMPIDVGYLQFFPVVEQIEHREAEIRVTISLREHL